MKLFSLFAAILTFFLAVYLKVTGEEWEFMAFLSLMNAVIVGWSDGRAYGNRNALESESVMLNLLRR